MIKIVQHKMNCGKKRNGIALFEVADAQFQEIWQEFYPERVVKEGENWVCPICHRHHHKKPGPFTLGVSANKTERTLSFSVISSGCCKWTQDFPFEKIKQGKGSLSNLIPQLRRSFYTR